MSLGPDTNKYLLLNQHIGWQQGALEGVVLDAECGQLHLQALPSLDRPLTDAQGDLGGLVLPISLAQDCEGRLYILDAQTLFVKRFDPCLQTFEILPWLGGEGSEPRHFHNPRRIAISGRNDLYVVDTGNRRVQVFALKGLGLRAIWGPLQVIQDDTGIHVQPTTAYSVAESDDIYNNDNDSDDRGADRQPGEYTYPRGTWHPWDVALSHRNWAYVSDYANNLIHVFDAQGQWRTAFPAKDKQQLALEKPTSLTLDQQGRLYVLQEGKAYITVLDSSGNFLQQVNQPADIQGNFCPLSVAVDEIGNIYLCDGPTRRLYYYCRTADNTYAGPIACQSFYCTGTALIFDKSGNPLILDAQQQKILQLKTTTLYQQSGQYYSQALDSEIYNCPWHRVLLSANILSGTAIKVETFTSETKKTIAEIQHLSDERWETNQTNSQVGCGEWDCLVRSQPGRYLWLRLTLTGEGMASPTIQQIRVYFPRSSSLQYLPATYSEDPDSRDFLDRFLSIFDTMYNKISQQVSNIAAYFDPASSPIAPFGQLQMGDFLTWLASWIGLTVDRHWSGEQKRQLVRQAHQLYKLRGTPEGLRQHIQLYMGTQPYIVEHFKLRHWLFVDSARLGDQSTLWGNAIMNRLQLNESSSVGSFQLIDSSDPISDPFYRDAYQFTVFLPIRPSQQQSDPLQQQTQMQTLQRIIEMAKPAYTQGHLQLVQPNFRIGTQSLIGLDTVIGRRPNKTIIGESKTNYSTILGASSNDEPPAMRIGKRSRIAFNTFID